MYKKSLIRGTLILAAAGIIAKFLGFFFRIPLINMIGEEGIGLYQLTYPLYTFLLALSAGIPVALSKMISERMALNRKREAVKIFRTAIIVMAVFGISSSTSLIIFSDSIINTFKWSKEAIYSLMGICLAPAFTCLLSVYRGYFQGLQIMEPPAVSQIMEQLIRICAGVGLAYLLLPKGIDVAAGGAAFGAAAGAFAALVWIMFKYRRNRIKYYHKEETRGGLYLFSEMLRMAIPISIGQAIGSIMALIDSIQVPGLLMSSGYSYQMATRLYGQLTGKAHVLINVPLTLSMALAQSTVPAISEMNAISSLKSIHKTIHTIFKFGMIIAIPCCAGLYALSKPILMLIFQGMGYGWRLLQILSVAAVFIIIAQVCTSILNGIGKTVLPVATMIFGCIIKAIISMIFVPVQSLNIKAAAYSTLFSYAVVALLDFIFVVKYTRVRFPLYKTFIGPAISSVVMIISVVFAYSMVQDWSGSSNLATMLSILVGAAVYIVFILLTKTLTKEELTGIIKRGL